MNFTVRHFLVLVMLTFTAHVGFGQRFYSVVFNQLPKDMQLYAREDDNTAEVPISGIIESAGWEHMSVVTYRNNKRVGYTKSVLNYGSAATASFEMKPKITAEMADYSFEIYACKATDSAFIAKRSEVVAGDFYVISGQSNGAATIFGAWSSKYARTVARTPDDSPAALPGDTLWTAAAWSWTYVGAWALEMQRSILENDSIPTCVINGSIPGKKLSEFLSRDEADPTNFSLYGGLLKRVRVAKPKRIRAFIWMHGEQEVFENIGNYAGEFNSLYNYWKQDYPEVDQFVVVQTNLILLRGDTPDRVAGETRDFLRRTKYLYPKTDHFAAIGTPKYDGVHYERAGYEEFGRRMYRFFRQSIYKSGDNDVNVRSPDIKKAFYTSADKKEIKLMFDEGQSLKWPADSTVKGQDGKPMTLSLKNFFFLDGDETKAAFSAGKAEANQVTLTLKEASNATKISYLPTYYPENLPLIEPFSFNIAIYTGPFLLNKNNLGAFSFDKVSLGTALASTELSANRTFNSVILSWKAVAGATSYVLEKKMADSVSYVLLDSLAAGELLYEDKDFELNATYTYRIQAVSGDSESPYSTVKVDLTPILGLENGKELAWEIYPNPVDEVIILRFKNPESGVIKIFNVAGQSKMRTEFRSAQYWDVNVSKWPAGTYLLEVEQKNGFKSTQKFIKR